MKSNIQKRVIPLLCCLMLVVWSVCVPASAEEVSGVPADSRLIVSFDGSYLDTGYPAFLSESPVYATFNGVRFVWDSRFDSGPAMIFSLSSGEYVAVISEKGPSIGYTSAYGYYYYMFTESGWCYVGYANENEAFEFEYYESGFSDAVYSAAPVWTNFTWDCTQYGLGNNVGTAPVLETVETTVIVGVNVDADNNPVPPGETTQFYANVYGTGDYDTDVAWSISGPSTADGTSISDSGLLTVAENETAAWLTVKATSVQDSSVYGTLTVTIGEDAEETEPPEETEPSEEPTETTVSVSDEIINGGSDPGSEELNSNIQSGVDDMDNAMEEVEQITLPTEEIQTDIEDLVDEESSNAIAEFFGRLTGNTLVTTQFVIAAVLTYGSYLLFGKKE